MTNDGPLDVVSGWGGVTWGVGAICCGGLMLVFGPGSSLSTIIGLFAIVGGCMCLSGLFTVAPNEACVVSAFGSCVGTVRDSRKKAALVSNLLVVLCSEAEAQPVISTSGGQA